MTNEKTRTILHQNVPILQVAEPFLLDTLLLDAGIAPYIVARLSDRTAIVEPKHVNAVLDRLLKLKHTPKVLEK